jgi:uncharacterized membrane protein YebE (DUF533 family)
MKLNALGLLGPLVTTALGSRNKRHAGALGFLTGGKSSFLNMGNLLALGGLGYAAYEVWRTHKGTPEAGRVVTPGTVVEGGLPPPIPPQARAPAPPPSFEDDVRRIVELTLAAARSDGELGEEEYGAILRTARDAGAEPMVREALDRPRGLAELVAGARDPKQREALYVYAFSIARADEDVRPAERGFLQELARHLGLDAALVARLEKETAYRIATLSHGTPGSPSTRGA